MLPPVYRRLLSALFALAVAGTASAQSLPAPPGLWWQTDSVKKELGLTNEQSARLAHIWQGMLPQLRDEKSHLDNLEARLSQLIEGDADEASVTHQIERVETLRAAMNKERVLLLVHMRQVLTPEQRIKINAIHARWEQDQKARQQAQQPQRPTPPSDPHKRPEQ